MDSSDAVTWWSEPGWQVLTTFIALLGAFIARRAWHKATKEFDRSMLICLGTDEEVVDYADVPIIVGQYPFGELAGKVESNLDVRNVIGFVIGKPKRVRNVRCLRLGLDPNIYKPGYYAYCVIQWEHANTVKRYVDQGFHIRKTRYDGPGMRPGTRERVFIGFGTDSTPDEETNDVPVAVHIQTGLLASLRYQPYLRGGFQATDIKMRALAPQTKFLIRFIKNPFTKEWRDAGRGNTTIS